MKDKVACGSFLPNYGKRKSVNEHLAIAYFFEVD